MSFKSKKNFVDLGLVFLVIVFAAFAVNGCQRKSANNFEHAPEGYDPHAGHTDIPAE